MSIPTKFNPMGAGVCGEPATVYKDFVQPVLLSNTTIDRTKPYSFGMSITDDYGNATAWQAFDSDAMSMWELSGTKPTAYLKITFEHPVLIEEVQAVWQKTDRMLAFQVPVYNDEGVKVGTIVMATGPSVKTNSFRVKNPVEVKNLGITVSQQGSSVVSIKFIGKYNAIYDKKSD